MNNDYAVLWVCQCCMLSHANGECCPDDDHGGDGIEPWSLYFSVDKAMGTGQEEHSCGREDDSYFGECDCEHKFSWSSCDGCGSRLAGDRYAFTLWTTIEER